MRIVSDQGVLPEHRYTQSELTHAFARDVARHSERVGRFGGRGHRAGLVGVLP